MSAVKPLPLVSIILVFAIGLWALLAPDSASNIAQSLVDRAFEGRGWFIMLVVTGLLFFCVWIAVSPYGSVKLGLDDDEPEFSTPAWLAMLFSAGMGVGLLF